MSDINYLLIGHCTADIVSKGRILGGTVSYASPVVQPFGHKVQILTSAAKNETLIKPLQNIARLHIIPSEHTTTFENIYTSSGRIQIVHHTASQLHYEMLPDGWRHAQLVHLAPLVNEIDISIAEHFPNATVLLTPQGLMRQWGDDGRVHFKRFPNMDRLRAVDILVLSKQDIIEAPDLEYEFPKYVKHVIVTDGENGGTYYRNGNAIPYAAYPVTEVDPTGAGDVFAASLLASLPLLNNDIVASISVAARMAAQAVTVKGTQLNFTQAEIQNIMHEVRQAYD